MTTLGLRYLGSIGPLGDDQAGAFAYPASIHVIPILSDGTSARNYVLQSSGLVVRQATLRCSVTLADELTLRGYSETGETVTYTDADGSTRDVCVVDFSSSELHADVWSVSLTMVELADPVGP